ncbi:L,D-transpeptidase [Tissierella praeacuta]|uniref:L,D-transpeptidase n=1 Tax=Tissierella praeacuta TaxID=43131 RepID=UPI0028A8C14B|nr:L,D-transpeptidase [Tissierella praeacuta]
MKKIISAILVITMIFALFLIVEASEQNSTYNYRDLFNKYLNSDGAISEGIRYEMADIFLENPEEFAYYMSEIDTELQEQVAFAICAEFAVRDLEELKNFESVLNDTINSQTVNEKSFSVLELITKIYESSYEDLTAVSIEESAPIESFDIEAIQNQINVNQINEGHLDEEFAFNMAQNYSLDPILFAKSMTPFDRATVSKVAENIAYFNVNMSMNKSYLTANSRIGEQLKYSLDDLDSNEKQILDFLQTEIKQYEDNNTGLIEEKVEESSIDIFSTQRPIIGNILYASKIEAGKTANLNVTFRETTAVNTTRNYYAKVYCIRNGSTYLKDSRQFSIPSGKSESTVNFSVALSHAGSFYTKVEVYSSPNGSLLVSRTGANPDISKGNWKIKVSLYKDRNKVGNYYLYNAGGDLIQSGSALGRSASNESMSTRNGNTPIGNYTGYLGAVQNDTAAYGPYKVVVMEGDNNYYVPRYRDGIWIHGGRSQSTLQPTNGCVRIFNTDQKKLQDNITDLTKPSNGHNRTGKISITE